jgi:transposase
VNLAHVVAAVEFVAVAMADLPSEKDTPGMHYVPVKSVRQQAQGMVLKVRETLISQRVALINTVRVHAAEFGVIAAKGTGQIVPLLSAIEQAATIPPEAMEMFVLLGRQIDEIEACIKEVDAN